MRHAEGESRARLSSPLCIFCPGRHDCAGGGGGHGIAGSGAVSSPLCSTSLTCGFVQIILVTTMLGLVSVEECGVQLGAVGVR